MIDIHIPLAAYEINLVNILFKILLRIIPLFVIQFILGLWYCSARDIEEKRIVAVISCISPVLFTPTYLFSPLFSVAVIDGFFNGTLTPEDIDEGWMLFLAAMGFHCLFWLCILIKNFVSSKK